MSQEPQSDDPEDIPPQTYLTPEERAKDLIEWRERIAEHYRQKKEKESELI